jgi:hypothetical protein
LRYLAEDRIQLIDGRCRVADTEPLDGTLIVPQTIR